MSRTKQERDLDKFLSSEGFKYEPTGVEALPVQDEPEGQAPTDVAPNQEESVVEAPVTDPVQPPQPEKPVQEDKHNWEKRKQDAQAAQRQLSEERNKLALEKRDLEAVRAKAQQDKEEIEALLRELREAKENVKPTKSQQQPSEPNDEEEDDEIKQFVDEYPDLAKVVERLSQRSARRVAKPILDKASIIDDLQRKLKEREAQTEQDQAKAAENSFFMEILNKHEDAFEIVQTPEFQNWIQRKPPVYRDIIDNTTRYSPQDAIMVLDEYRGQKPKPTRPDEGDMAVSVRRSQPPMAHGGDDEGDVFTEEEMANLGVIANSYRTPEQRRKFDEKLARTLTQ